jgi:PAS domain S-box-containing protein
MKLFSSYLLIKRSQLESIRSEALKQKGQIEIATDFIREIEKGNLEAQYALAEQGTDDNLTASLLSMRDQMKRIAVEEKERNWVTGGMAKFVEILRSSNDETQKLGDQIITQLVKYMGANQGALYIVKDDDPQDVHLERISCYAYSRKKHQQQRFNLGEGLSGQAVLEKQTMYMTNIPDNYIRITSGLGEALPRNVLIVPLKMEDQVFGVVEIASFHPIKPYQIEFVERLGESIASTVANVKINQRTKQLLSESQQRAEEMKSQEEEMRQNMEELAATQEEMQRVLNEVQSKEGYQNQLLNVSKDSIYTVDRNHKLVSWNKAFAATLEYFGIRLEKGMNVIEWYQGEERVQQVEYFKRAFTGEIFEMTSSADNNGALLHFHITYTPLRNDRGEFFEVAVFSKDITPLVSAQKNAEKLLKEEQNRIEEIKSQEEELRQNMEELSATQEEMHRVLTEVQNKERLLDELINVSRDSIFAIDRDYKVISYNKVYEEAIKAIGVAVAKGMDALAFYEGEEKVKHKALYDRTFAGESFEETHHFSINNVETDYVLSYAPLRDVNGEVMAAAIYARNVTK